jgi:hypothetical protein
VIPLAAGTDNFASLNEAQYLYLRRISEPRDNAVRIVVQEAVANTAKEGPLDLPGLSGKFPGGKASPIESTGTCQTFVLTWARYVSYLVTEEMVGSCGKYDDQVFTGKRFRVYTKSHLLDHIARDTGGHFKPLRHYKLICLNHLIDVVSEMPPDIDIGLPGENF